ncbi:MAG: hypothetical protein A4E73_02446 [Syntrophaceae bacterium PtaU1.Bin231]|nr:MAG: hypothetical protein A4E73_02446 [Syntrophaceae bacterium PtaU1.Bin231]
MKQKQRDAIKALILAMVEGRRGVKPARKSKYAPHQGKAEMARRCKKTGKGGLRNGAQRKQD